MLSKSASLPHLHLHTLALFREVIYRYTTEQAILDGFLVDYDAVKIKSDVRMNGIFLKPGEHVGVVDTETGTKPMMNWKTNGNLPSRY